jgi:predicted DsbA family dithiol-disulfide isomerase
MVNPVELDVFSDIVCPWCLIGKRRLEKALALHGGEVTVRWHAYQLAPELPPEGVEARPHFEAKFGSHERMRALFARVAEVGKGDGIPFDLEAQARAPNTRLAHRALQVAQGLGKGREAAEALFTGHFLERADVARLDEIVALFERHAVGVDTAALRDALAKGAGNDEVDRDLRFAREAGISGVPFFVANGRLGLSGAQDVETFVRFLQRAGEG